MCDSSIMDDFRQNQPQWGGGRQSCRRTSGKAPGRAAGWLRILWEDGELAVDEFR